MATERAYVAGLAELASIGDPQERRRTWRQGVAALATALADDRTAPLEGLDPGKLLASMQLALADGLLGDLGFVPPASAATATFALATGLPPGPVRRDLGRRVLEQLDHGDAETFAALATALALASRRPLPVAKRTRVPVVLAAPLSAGTAPDALALALLAGPELQRAWLDEPATGPLPARRTAARVLERAAREATRRYRSGDDAGVLTLMRTGVRTVADRLLADREALVWRHVAIARGLLATAAPTLAAEIEAELTPTASPSAWRRGAASLAARLEVEPQMAARVRGFLDGELPGRDRGVVRGFVASLGGPLTTEPDLADALACRAIERAGLEAIEALAELRGELGAVLPRASALALAQVHQARAAAAADDGTVALLGELAAELGGAEPDGGSLAASARQARDALRAGQLAAARRAAQRAADAADEAVEFLARYDDGDSMERRHALRTLRELDAELLADGTVVALLASGEEGKASASAASRLGGLQGRLEKALLAREREPATPPIQHPTLRLARLRALVRVVDAEAPGDDPVGVRDRRLAVVRALMSRARRESSSLRRAVWAALTRAFDAMLRDEQLELSDLLTGWTAAMDPDEDFAIAREASMVPEVRDALDAYAAGLAAATAAADPDDRAAAIAAVTAAQRLIVALGAASSPRTDALRANLGALVRALDAVVRARGQLEVSAATMQQLEASCAVVADLAVGARRRLGLPVTAPGSPAAMHELALTLERLRRGSPADVAVDATLAASAAADDQPPLVARLLGVALARLSILPAEAPATSHGRPSGVLTAVAEGQDTAEADAASLPRWMPPSRTVGGFYVVRPLGKGAGGSVFVACRTEDRRSQTAEQVALKVPEYDGGAARDLSLEQFEALFREEAGALLALPAHPNIARFVTFDAGARPKPILVMELVRGATLERVLDLGELDMPTALRLCDGIAAGLGAMHAARIAHLDLKPANVILRHDGSAMVPVLVDFGLAGRRLRKGCGSPHYGAPEVWAEGVTVEEPMATDVYALACLVFELLTGSVLVGGEALSEVLSTHVVGGAAAAVERRLGHDERLAPLGKLLAAALAFSAEARPTVGQFRAGLAALAPVLAPLGWPLEA